MLGKTRVAPMTMLSIVLCVWGIFAAAQKQPAPMPGDQPALGIDEVKRLLLLMDSDRNGKISKQEWMTFMEAEFDRLDKNHTGMLDVNEIAKSNVRVSRFAKAGK